MGEALKKRLKTVRFASPAHEASLALVLAAGALRDMTQAACSRHGISEQQYNVLRILRGALPDGYARCDVLDRMIDRASDVTRIIDRLEDQKLVRRGRSGEDRRLSLTYITEAGLALLERIDPEIAAVHGRLGHLISVTELRQLTSIAERIFEAAQEMNTTMNDTANA